VSEDGSNLYPTPGNFQGGTTIQFVGIDSGDDVYKNLELEAKRLHMQN
jgi:hypothetical protein